MFSAARPAVASSVPHLGAPVNLKHRGPTDPAEIETFLDQLFNQQMKEYHFAGITAVVVKDGQTLFQKGYGFSEIENQIPVNPAETLFRIGSVTKLFTWTAIHQLSEQGRRPGG
jgi:CubicO group peptidase (beta-lactamase class C family)